MGTEYEKQHKLINSHFKKTNQKITGIVYDNNGSRTLCCKTDLIKWQDGTFACKNCGAIAIYL